MVFHPPYALLRRVLYVNSVPLRFTARGSSLPGSLIDAKGSVLLGVSLLLLLFLQLGRRQRLFLLLRVLEANLGGKVAAERGTDRERRVARNHLHNAILNLKATPSRHTLRHLRRRVLNGNQVANRQLLQELRSPSIHD